MTYEEMGISEQEWNAVCESARAFLGEAFQDYQQDFSTKYSLNKDHPKVIEHMSLMYHAIHCELLLMAARAWNIVEDLGYCEMTQEEMERHFHEQIELKREELREAVSGIEHGLQ